MTLWMGVLLAAGGYCLVRGGMDLRQRRFVWGVLGILSGALLWLTPIGTHAIKLDLPRPAGR